MGVFFWGAKPTGKLIPKTHLTNGEMTYDDMKGRSILVCVTHQSQALCMMVVVKQLANYNQIHLFVTKKTLVEITYITHPLWGHNGTLQCGAFMPRLGVEPSTWQLGALCWWVFHQQGGIPGAGLGNVRIELPIDVQEPSIQYFGTSLINPVCFWLWQALQISHAGEAGSFGNGYQLWSFQWYHDWCRICQHSLPDSQHQTGRSPMGSTSLFNLGVSAHWLKQVLIFVLVLALTLMMGRALFLSTSDWLPRNLTSFFWKTSKESWQYRPKSHGAYGVQYWPHLAAQYHGGTCLRDTLHSFSKADMVVLGATQGITSWGAYFVPKSSCYAACECVPDMLQPWAFWSRFHETSVDLQQQLS